jgi:hypothetical protein
MDKDLQRLYKEGGTWTCLRDVYRRIGFRGLYSGVGLHLGEHQLTFPRRSSV